MHALNDFLTTDYGLMSAGVIAFTLVMGAYIGWYVRRHVRDSIANHDRLVREGRA